MAMSCPPPAPKNHRTQETACGVPTSPFACSTDADCTAKPGLPAGKCVTTPTGNICDYNACTTDADCGGMTPVCSCQVPTLGPQGPSFGSVCIPGDCRIDADCGAGFFCSPTVSASCGAFFGIQGYYCHTCQDTCINDSDCPADNVGAPGYCAFDLAVGHWSCFYGVCAG
jgi:hypothetical protein